MFDCPAVEISGTAAELDETHTFTCALTGSSATNLEYQWSIGDTVEQRFSPNNQFLVFSVDVSDARSDYTCEVREVGTTDILSAGNASLNVASEYTVSFFPLSVTNYFRSTKFWCGLQP